MIADTSDIQAWGTTHRRHAVDLASAAAELRTAVVAADVFGPVGAGFLAALNQALMREADRAAKLAEDLEAATTAARMAAAAYQGAEGAAGRAISATGV